MRGREALVAALVASLVLPAWAGPAGAEVTARALGTLASGEATSIRNVGAVPGTTIFSGDIVDVGAQGSAYISVLGGTQVVLGSDSRARMAKAGNLVEVEVLRGRARFRSTENAPVVGRLGDATLRSSNGAAAVGIISMVAANKAYIAAEKGELILQAAYSAKSVTLREGEAVEVSLAPPPAAPPPPASALTGTQITFIVIAITAVALGIGLKLALDKDGLTDAQKRNLVSPFTFP
ncbi:MAG TPA: hypothetical protein VNL38_01710 [Candidatus Nitrosotenuis sp.]|nr:hypothetical protein [Candidatus Nitrosotenuis sp.]